MGQGASNFHRSHPQYSEFPSKSDPAIVPAALLFHRGVDRVLPQSLPASLNQYLGWVDSDDLLAPTALAQTIALLDRQPQVGLVYTQYEVIDEQGRNYGLGQR